MEKSSRTKKTGSKKKRDEVIREAYIEYILTEGQEPPSIFQFAKHLKLTEEDIYEYYNSFSGIEKDIWHQYFNTTIQSLEAEAVYAEYSIREKLLAFYFTLFGVLQKNRSYVLVSLKHLKKGDVNPRFLKVFKLDFEHYIKELIQEGIETGEVVSRPYVSDRYHKGFWVQMIFLLQFWINDESTGFEKTDAAVEKSVNLSLDLIAKGPLDSMFDFAKFVAQNR
ncbi:MAG: TetR family transcriptional regulator C-terminal domain-containing protein [Bacteroidota bacterium]